jgi:hypothetical protein
MTFSHDDANARLVDLVYGEGTAEERAALEAHVATCPACTTELASLGGTRTRVRAALEDAPVPAPVHVRILEAAAQAAAPVAAAATPVRAAVAAPGRSFWETLRRRWTLPTFATVGAVAIVVIASKVFLEPEKTMERGREIATSTAAPASPPTELDKNVEPPAPSDNVLPTPQASFGASGATEALKRARGGVRPGLLGGNAIAQRLSRMHAGGNNLAGEGAGAPAELQPAKGGLDGLLERGRGDNRAPTNVPRPAARADDQAADVGSARSGFASPPSGWAGGPPGGAPASATAPPPMPPPAAPVAAPRAAAPARRDETTPLADLDGARGAPAAEAEMQPARREKKEERRAEPPAAATASTEGGKDAEKASDQSAEDKTDGAPSQEALARRADKLYAARRWSAAIAAYRELLRRYPDAEVTPSWRARVAEAEAQLGGDVHASKAAAKAAKRSAAAPAKAKAADPPAQE